MYLRCFVAIEIPEPIKEDIRKLIEIFKKHSVDIKWVEYKNIHLTLKFLGKTSEDLLPRIHESFHKVAISYKPLYIKICKVGVFPNRKYPRVIWVGIENSETLGRLQRDIENSMALLGFQREEKAFHPHLTFGRFRSQRGMGTLMNELDSYKEKDFGVIEVTNIKLMSSELKPTGAQYHCLCEIPFGRREDDK